MKEGRNGERGRERGEERGTKVERNGGREGEWGRKEGGREEKGRMPPHFLDIGLRHCTALSVYRFYFDAF